MKKIEIEDILNYRYPANLSYSPDGSVLAFEVSKAKEDQSGYVKDVYVIKDDRTFQLTSGMNTGIVCFEDEEHLLVRRDAKDHEEGTTDLFMISVNGGEAMPFRTFPFVMTSLKKAGSLYVASGIIDRHDPDAYLDDEKTRKEKAEERKKNADYQVIDEIPYWLNGTGFTNGKRQALFVINGEKIRRITGANTEVNEYVIDGSTVYYTAETWSGKQAMREQVFSYDLKTGKTAKLFAKKTHAINNLFVIAHQLYAQATDKKAYGSNETGMIVMIKDGELVFVKDPVLNLHSSVGSDVTMGGGKQNVVYDNHLYSLVTDDDHTVIWKFDRKFHHQVLFDRPGAVKCLDVRKDKIAFIYSDERHLFEVYELRSGKLKKRTSLNDEALKDKYIAKPQRIDYESCGEKLHGWVLLPEKTSRKKIPAVLDIHGGPRVVYGTNFFHEMQLWASRGFAVMFTNIRGSDGRGDEFADIRDAYGTVDYENLMDFTDAVLKAYPNIDENRICVTGGSYGGFMTNWIITQTDRFCCAASQRSISNWISKALISDIGYFHNADQHGAPHIFDGFDHLWLHSPLKYAANVKTPTLFIHSDQDYRCPLPEGMQMMQALAMRNVETRMCIFKGENHELSRSGKPAHRIRRLQEITGWFEKHTK